MIQLQTFKEWLIFFRRSLIFAVIAVCILFWNSPHGADEIAVSVAIPLIIFNCFPLIISGISMLVCAIVPPSPQQNLPLPTVQQPDYTNPDLPMWTRIRAGAVLFGVLTMIVAFCASIAIFAGSFFYGYFDIQWAIDPARELALVAFCITVLPLVAVFSFIAGMRYSGRLWNSLIVLTVYLRTIRPFSYWPTLAA